MSTQIQYKKFVFSASVYRFPQFECIRIAGDNCERRTFAVTDATYNRFARLADSNAYHVSILPADEGVAWQLVRLYKTPGVRDPYALPPATRPACPVEADGDIIFA